ncbi:hypothetical protein OIU77_003138 [Salix suchowensis]|uniref:Protein kinase domain-containing protein n=1 Tax=Salix suchowensis TaxID=1278906 RepID=A0ABQ9B0Y2_9ROSI|nr:hypothetical protein OIU77_003138 [Salix suchowensis]
MHPPPTFGSSPNLEAFRYHVEDGDGAANSTSRFSQQGLLWTDYPLYYIVGLCTRSPFSTVDSPKLLSQAGGYYHYRPCRIFLMYCEQFGIESAMLHMFFRTNISEKENLKSKEQCFPKQLSVSLDGEENKTGVESLPDRVEIPSDGTDVWEIDTSQLKVEHKVASGSYGDLQVLCQGTYCSQEVAIKVVEPERVSGDMLREFSQEAYIMRKIQHKNVVQFIDMSYCANRWKWYWVGVCLGAKFHRDLKTANLLMDENEVVKVADFGVARVQNQPGVMTAETGTYRWMAPELPYSYLTPLQAAVGVVQKGLRPTIPKHTHPKLAELLERCRLDLRENAVRINPLRRARTCTCNQTSSCSVCRAMRDCFLACTAQANTCNITRLWSAQNTLLAFQYLNHKAQESIIMVPNKIGVDYTTYNKVTTETCLNCDCCCIFCGGSSKAFVGGLFTSLSICQKRRTSLDESW